MATEIEVGTFSYSHEHTFSFPSTKEWSLQLRNSHMTVFGSDSIKNLGSKITRPGFEWVERMYLVNYFQN